MSLFTPSVPPLPAYSAVICLAQALNEQCAPHGCGFSCQCHSCDEKPVCDCSCRWLVVGGLALLVLSGTASSSTGSHRAIRLGAAD